MKLLEIKDIEKKEIPLYYRNEYSASASVELQGKKRYELPIGFSVEMAPTGEKSIDLKFLKSVDYPLVPVYRLVKNEIAKLEKEGKLN